MHPLSAILFLLAGLLATEPPKAQKTAELNQLRLYVPIPKLKERFGNRSAEPLAKYIKALEKRTVEVLSKQKRPEAKGLLIAVGIKSKKKTRIWCESVEGKCPPKLLRLLEAELAKVEAVDLERSPAGFALEVNLYYGQKPSKYPAFPSLGRRREEEQDEGSGSPG